MVLRIFILYEKQMQTLNTNVKHNFKVDYNKKSEQQVSSRDLCRLFQDLSRDLLS